MIFSLIFPLSFFGPSQLNMKLSKNSKYNLSDGEEDDFESLDIQGKDDFEDEMLPDEDDDGAEGTETESTQDCVSFRMHCLRLFLTT